MNRPFTITIDSREISAHPGIAACLRRSEGVTVEVAPLQFGDYTFTGGEPLPGKDQPPRIGIEVSTVSDLCGKVNGDRFGYQMTGLIQDYDVGILLVAGVPRPDVGGYLTGSSLGGSPVRMEWHRLMSALFAAQCHGIIIQYARSADQDIVAGSIYQMAKYWQAPYAEHKLFRKYGLQREAVMPLGVPCDPRIQLLMGIPGVGEKRAANALNELGSLFAIFTASKERLAMIPDWGPRVAAAAYEFIWRGLK